MGAIEDNDGLDTYANFHNIGFAMLSLFRVATGDAWEELRDGTNITKHEDPDCASKHTCGNPISPIYWVTFIVIGACVMLELFLAVILENFGNADDEMEFGEVLKQMELWRDVWEIYDPLSTGYVPVFAFEDLMCEAPKPFGLGGPVGRFKLLRFFRRINVPIHLTTLTKKDMVLRNTMITRSKSSLHQNKSSVLFDQKTFAKKGESGQELFCVNFQEALLTLAKIVSGFNVDLDFTSDAGNEVWWLHEWYAVKNIQDVWALKIAIKQSDVSNHHKTRQF